MGDTSGPTVALFKKFKTRWEDIKTNIDYSNLVILNQSLLPDWMQKEAKKVLSWAENMLKTETFDRGDYKELLQLLIIYLGETVEKFSFKKPGADHHARWLSKAIYNLKICMLQNNFQMTAEERHQVETLSRFISVIYCKYWFTTPTIELVCSKK